ncbi:MAG: hypothetical protein LBU06_05445, partial [Desulfovibrio sp.]|nr:hypothetical protein [Desulfovibrio sp.]
IPFARVRIFENTSPGKEEALGEAADIHGVFTKNYADRCNIKTIYIEAVYDADERNFKKEVARLKIENFDTENPIATEAENVIRGIQDVNQTKNDRDYYEKVDLRATGNSAANHDEEVEAKTIPAHTFTKTDFVSNLRHITRTGDGAASSSSTGGTGAADSGQERPQGQSGSTHETNTVYVVMYMATFSLNVPYLSQTKYDEHVETKPPKDKKSTGYIHQIEGDPLTLECEWKALGGRDTCKQDKDSHLHFSGDRLCGLTSICMIFDYHNIVITDDMVRSIIIDIHCKGIKTASGSGISSKDREKAQNAVREAEKEYAEAADAVRKAEAAVLQGENVLKLGKKLYPDVHGSPQARVTSLAEFYRMRGMPAKAEDVLRNGPDDITYAPGFHKVWEAEKALASMRGDLERARQRLGEAAKKLKEAKDTADAIEQARNSLSLPALERHRTRIMVAMLNIWLGSEGYRPWQGTKTHSTLTTLLGYHGRGVRCIGGIQNASFDDGRVKYDGAQKKSLLQILAKGAPIGAGMKGGHLLVVRGAVVNRERHAVRIICNDPYGTLSGPSSENAWYSEGEHEYNGDKPARRDKDGNSFKAQSQHHERGRHVYYRGHEQTLEHGTTTRVSPKDKSKIMFNLTEKHLFLHYLSDSLSTGPRLTPAK